MLRVLKSDVYPYQDATNVVGFHSRDVLRPRTWLIWTRTPRRAVSCLIRPRSSGCCAPTQVYRYCDLVPPELARDGWGLARLVQLIERSAARHGTPLSGVDIVAQSMGGLVVRDGLLAMDSAEPGWARRLVHRVVTLGTTPTGASRADRAQGPLHGLFDDWRTGT